MAFRIKGGIQTETVKLSPVHLLILSLLHRKPSHGYMIIQGLRQNLEGWSIKSGTVYPALHRLVELELIVGEEVEQDDRPDAIEYRLTPRGKKVLKQALHGLGSEFRVQDSFWRFLGATASHDVSDSILQWSVRERSPMGFHFMKCQCGDPQGGCKPKHLDFLKKYREYLHQELEWIDSQLSTMKSSKKKK
ncbi:MAG: PadR family transcriptional regulator [Candidatus Thorarchaeota archaeon]|jgi:DNA-binding PadR family transcriptional regulator